MIAVAAFVVAAGLYLGLVSAAWQSIYGRRRRVIVVGRTPGHQCRLGDIPDDVRLCEAHAHLDDGPDW